MSTPGRAARRAGTRLVGCGGQRLRGAVERRESVTATWAGPNSPVGRVAAVSDDTTLTRHPTGVTTAGASEYPGE